MTANPSRRKRVSRLLSGTVLVLFVMALTYDVIHIRKWHLGQTIEDSFIAAYPTAKFYRDYVLRVHEFHTAVRTQQFYSLHIKDESEGIVSMNSMAWIDLRQGPVTLHFPDLPPLRHATVTFIDWDGLVIGGESAYRTSYTLFPPGSPETNTPTTLTSQGGTVLAFIRIPTAESPDEKSLVRLLEKIRFTNSQQQLILGEPIKPEMACEGDELGTLFIACMEALIALAAPPKEQVDAYQTARKRLGNIDRIPRKEWMQSVNDARQMIDQAITNGISLVTRHMWIAYQHMFTLRPEMVQLRLNRAAYARSDFVAAPSDKMKYAIKRYNARGEAINGLKHDYLLHFDPRLLPADVTEWHFIVRDHTKRLFKSGQRLAINSDDALKREVDGTIKIYLTHQKPADIPEANWLGTPKDFFEIIFLGRGTKAGRDFDYFEYLPELETIH
jgi:hypothetical protein